MNLYRMNSGNQNLTSQVPRLHFGGGGWEVLKVGLEWRGELSLIGVSPGPIAGIQWKHGNFLSPRHDAPRYPVP